MNIWLLAILLIFVWYVSLREQESYTIDPNFTGVPVMYPYDIYTPTWSPAFTTRTPKTTPFVTNKPPKTKKVKKSKKPQKPQKPQKFPPSWAMGRGKKFGLFRRMQPTAPLAPMPLVT